MEFQVGGYGVSQWGYDQTNTDFYKVVRKSKSSVWLLPVYPVVEETNFMSGYSVPTDRPHGYKDKVIMKRVTRYEQNGQVNEHCGGWYGSEMVFPWDGKKMTTSWYA